MRFTEVVVRGKPGSINSPQLDKPLHKLSIGGQEGWSRQFDEVEKLILEMTLDNGVVGIGEFYRGHDWPVVRSIAGMLVGRSLDTLPLQALPIARCREYDGFECAIWDAFARSFHLRVVDLLGGAVQDRIKVGAWTGHRLRDEIGDIAAGFAGQGYTSLKFKCDLEDDVAGWCEEVRRAAPDMQIILDPNERWENMANVKRLLPRLQAVGNILCLEDPLPRWMLGEYARLRQMTDIPIFMHVSLPYVSHGQRPHDAINALQHGAVDGFNFNGGLAAFQRLDHIAATAGLNCWHGSELDLGILEAMYLHSIAAAPSCTLPSDVFGRMVREHDLLRQPLRIEAPWAYLPDGPGLGVELDQLALNNHRCSTWLLEVPK